MHRNRMKPGRLYLTAFPVVLSAREVLIPGNKSGEKPFFLLNQPNGLSSAMLYKINGAKDNVSKTEA